MNNLTEQFNKLANKMQDEALLKNNSNLFVEISKLRGLMYDIKIEQYSKGVDMVVEIYKPK